MSIPYELQGRRRQKARTRRVVVEAARTLISEGITPTVEQAAEHSGVARTTAYRYFPNQRALLLAVYPEIEAVSLLGVDPPRDPSDRLDVVIENLCEQTVEHEAELRATLRIALEPGALASEPLPFRRGRAIGWIEDALAPLRDEMTEEDVHRLALAIRASSGIEALVWLTDVGGLSREEAVSTMRWSARALLRAALEDRSLLAARQKAPT